MNRIRLLEMAGICKSFQALRANHEISLRIEAGEILGLLGAVSYTHLTLPTN